MNWKDKVTIARWLRANTSSPPAEIAAKLDIRPEWIGSALGIEPLPHSLADRRVSYAGQVGQIHEVIDVGDRALFSIYRHGPRGNYVGFVEASQIRSLA